jgi:hypothetical protein
VFGISSLLLPAGQQSFQILTILVAINTKNFLPTQIIYPVFISRFVAYFCKQLSIHSEVGCFLQSINRRVILFIMQVRTLL